MSTAFLSTSHYADQDSLSARMVQARFSGMFRFSCKAFVQYMSDPTTAAAGSKGPDNTSPVDDPEYTAPWDRNLLLMAAALFAESFLAETGVSVPSGYGAHEFWHDNCMVILYDSNPILPLHCTHTRHFLLQHNGFGDFKISSNPSGCIHPIGVTMGCFMHSI